MFLCKLNCINYLISLIYTKFSKGKNAEMAELVDAPDSKSGELITREGSIPSPGTTNP